MPEFDTLRMLTTLSHPVIHIPQFVFRTLLHFTMYDDEVLAILPSAPY
jgi:hypothetical protein